MADDRRRPEDPPATPAPITKTSIPPATDVDRRDDTTIDRLASTRAAMLRGLVRIRQ